MVVIQVSLKQNGKLLIAQRNYVFNIDEIDENKNALYSGLYGWLKEYGEDLTNRLIEGSGLFGEWIGMGKLKYNFNKKLYMFAKANYENGKVKNIYYDHDLFIYPFENQEFPEYIGVVPVVSTLKEYPEIDTLNKLYSDYTYNIERNVEGFIIIHDNSIKKYVRMKNGIIKDHHE